VDKVLRDNWWTKQKQQKFYAKYMEQ
jgi:hypothetical protein